MDDSFGLPNAYLCDSRLILIFKAYFYLFLILLTFSKVGRGGAPGNEESNELGLNKSKSCSNLRLR